MADFAHTTAAWPTEHPGIINRRSIEALQYKSLRYDTGMIRARLEAELVAID